MLADVALCRSLISSACSRRGVQIINAYTAFFHAVSQLCPEWGTELTELGPGVPIFAIKAGKKTLGTAGHSRLGEGRPSARAGWKDAGCVGDGARGSGRLRASAGERGPGEGGRRLCGGVRCETAAAHHDAGHLHARPVLVGRERLRRRGQRPVHRPERGVQRPAGKVRVCTEVIEIPGDLCPKSNVASPATTRRRGCGRPSTSTRPPPTPTSRRSGAT